jgi:hypothetical protein
MASASRSYACGVLITSRPRRKAFLGDFVPGLQSLVGLHAAAARDRAASEQLSREHLLTTPAGAAGRGTRFRADRERIPRLERAYPAADRRPFLRSASVKPSTVDATWRAR